MTEFNSYRTDFKVCSKCKETKPATEYSGKTSTYCKPCFRDYRANWRKTKNTSEEWTNRYKPQSAEARTEKKQYVLTYLQCHPCETCGESDPLVLEFDHLDQTEKVAGVSHLAHQGTFDALKAEIDKCRVLCANCHRRHTAKQLGWFKFI